MNTKGIKFLAVLAVLAVAFAAFAIISDIAQNDADDAEVVIDDYHFNFGGTVTTVITYDGYGNITVADVQSLTAEKDGDTIILSGDLVKLDNDAVDGSVLTIKKMYGGAAADLPALYGIAFKITGLPEGAKVSLNAGETTIDDSGEDALYQPIKEDRTTSSATSFTVTIKADGIHSKVYTIDFSDLLKAQSGSKKYLSIQDAIDDDDASTVNVLADTAMDVTIDRSVSLVGTGTQTLSGKVIIPFKRGVVGSVESGNFVFKNLNFELSNGLILGEKTLDPLAVNDASTTASNTSITFDSCKLKAMVNGLSMISVAKAPATLIVKDCDFSVKTGATGFYAIQQYGAVSSSAAASYGTLSVTGCTFNEAFREPVMTFQVNNITFKENVVKNAPTKAAVQIGAVETMSALTVDITGNDMPDVITKGALIFNELGNFTVESVKVQGLVYFDAASDTTKFTTVTIPTNKTMEAKGIHTNVDSTYKATVIVNGTLTSASDIDNVGILTINAGGILNLDGKIATKGTFTNSGTIICKDAYQYSLAKTALGADAGVIKVAGSSPSDTPVVPEPKPVDEQGKIDVDADVKVVVATGTVKQAVAKADQAIIISTLGADAVLDVSNSGSEISLMGAMTADQTATVKTATGSVTVKGIMGNVTFSSGSIIVLADPWSGGDITLKNGDVLKISGTIDTASNILFSGTGSATVIIEEGADKKLTLGAQLNIKSDKITVQVDGTIDGASAISFVDATTATKGGNLIVKGTVNAPIAGNAAITVDGKVTGNIAGKSITISSTGEVDSESVAAASITVNGKLKATAVIPTGKVSVYGTASGEFDLSDEDAALVAYGASDINKVTLKSPGAVSDENTAKSIANMKKVSGMDANGGTWTFDGEGKLTLTGYNGKFNLGITNLYNANGTFAHMTQKIILSGDSEIKYTLPETSLSYALFDSVTDIKTVQGEGSLDIEMDISKASKVAVSNLQGIAVFKKAGTLSLSSVIVSVTVKGTNSNWDLDDTKVFGVVVNNLKMNSSSLNVDVLSNITAKLTSGIDCLALSLVSSGIIASSAGTGIDVDADDDDAFAAELSDGSTILTTGKVLGMSVDNSHIGLYYDALELSGSSSVVVANGFTVGGDVELSQSSLIAAEKFEYVAGTLTNNATVTLSDVSVIKKDAEIDNLATMTNKGTINVFGIIDNQGGTFTNEGNITVFAKKYADAAGQATIFKTAVDPTKISSTSAELERIIINEAELQNNGSLKITKATAKFTYKSDLVPPVSDADFKNLDGFTGTLVPVQSSAGNDYVLTLSNGTATISLTYSSTATGDGKLGEKYTLTVSGTIAKNVGTDKFSVVMPTGTDKTVTDGIGAMISDSTSNDLKVTGGKMVNSSVVNFYGKSATDYAFVAADAEYEGPIVAGAQTLTIAGTISGDITSKGALNVNGTGLVKGKVNVTGAVTVGNNADSTAKINGNVTTKGAVSITKKASIEGDITSDSTVTSAGGAIKGNVTAKDDVTVYNVEGNITVDKNGDYKVTIKGKVLGTLTYNSAAKATVPGEGEKVDPTTYPVVMTIDADLTKSAEPKALVINLNKAIDATETEAVKKGYFSIGNADVAELDDGKNVNLTMKVGKLKFPETMTMPVRYAIVFEADTIAEVSSVATVDFSNSALKVSKDATSNFVTGTTTVTEYGLVKAIMSFAIESGAYTIYSGVTYALANCEENSELKVELDATLTDNVVVKAGVNVIVSDKVTLDFDKYGMDMDEGAKITLLGTGKVTFKKTGENLYPGDDTKDYVYYEINGTIVFDDNSIILDSVRFCGDGTSTIKGVAATSTAASKLDIDVTYNQGIISTATGMASGKVVLENCKYYATKADAEAGKYTKAFAMLRIADETVFDATSITDMAMDAELDASKNIEILMLPTIVTVNGVLNLNGSTTVNGLYNGDGIIVLAKNKEIIVPQSTRLVVDAATEDYYYFGGDFNGTVTNALIGGDVITIEGMMANIEAGNKIVLIAYESSSEAYFKLKGQMLSGETISEEIVLDGLNIADNATVAADAVKIVNASVVTGKLCAKEIDTDSLKKLTYDTTYEALGYTVYTVFENIDWEVITDVTLAASKKLSDFGIEEGKKLDLSGRDVNITIAEGKTLTLDRPLIIGTPIDDIAGEGSSISGKVIIGLLDVIDAANTKYYNSYIVAYSDVDLTEAEIYGYDGKTAAVYSILDIEDIPYAMIFANENGFVDIKTAGVAGVAQTGQVLATVDKSIVPEIEGYVFTKWYNYDETEGSFVGQTNAYAGAKAVTVFVTVKFVTGITYYCNGIEFAIYDTPVKVDYNSVFTAKISDTSKYQGTPLVNGKNSLIITEDTEIVGSGVSPIPVPPEPEPVIGDSGISLTDILLIVLVVLIAIMVVILVLRLNRS